MNAELTRQIQNALEQCDRYIAKEEPRNPELRPADVAQRLEFYKAHREKLTLMLKTGLVPFQLYSAQTGNQFGQVEAESESDAVDRFAQSKGYKDRHEMWRLATGWQYVSAHVVLKI